jgi:hypothetical protein
MRLRVEIAIPAFFIVVAESLYFTKHPTECMAVHILNIMFCAIAPTSKRFNADLLLAFMLVSILRVVGLAMPIFFELTIYTFVLIYGTAILAALVVLRGTRPLGEFARSVYSAVNGAFRKVERHVRLVAGLLLSGLLISYLLANIEYRIIYPGPLIPSMTVSWLAVLAVIMIVFVGFGEELIFRYILQSRLENEMGASLSIFLASGIFAAMHSVYFSPLYLVYVFGVGVFLGYSFQRTRSLGFVSLVHGAINFFLFSFLPNGQLRFF